MMAHNSVTVNRFRLATCQLTLALSLAMAWPVAASAQAPETVTPEWLVENYLHGFMPSVDEARRQSEMWVQVRSRPDAFQALRQVAEDSTQPRIVRTNAILRMGNTSQPQAYAYLESLYARLQSGDRLRARILESLGTGFAPAPESVITLLGNALRSADSEERASAVSGLGYLDTEQSRGILRAYLARETDPSLRAHARDALEWRRPQLPSKP